jgi:hypothetical protein
MSILKALGLRSVLLSFLEVVLFFAVITPLYFSLVATPYALAKAPDQLDATLLLLPLTPAGLSHWAAILPVWMWALEIAGYLLLVTIYWAPGDPAQSRAELGGLVLFIVLAAVGGIAWLEMSHRYVSQVIWTFWGIVTGRAPTPG